MRKEILSVVAISAVAVVAGAWQVAGKKASELPAPFATPSATNRPHVISQPEAAKVIVPSGFTVDVWAEGFLTPRFMLQGGHGEILLSDSGSTDGTGKIYAFPGGDPKQRKEVVTGLTRPYGLALWHEYLYVGEPTSIKRFKYDPTTFTATDGKEIFSLSGDQQGHWTRSLLFDREGKKLYVGVGSAGNIEVGNEGRAAINRMNPDGSDHEIFASGTRNPIGLHWYPGTDTLWAVVQERDALGDDLVPDYFTHIEPHGFYGYPWAYSGQHKEPQAERSPGYDCQVADSGFASWGACCGTRLRFLYRHAVPSQIPGWRLRCVSMDPGTAPSVLGMRSHSFPSKAENRPVRPRIS
jgi:glucose/arabinose dehydrogenase